MSSTSRTARIFLSSTFRDFGEERDLLVRKVFPGLRERLKDRFVELVDVDLRWGITAEQAERGEVLPICLAEIDRARPFFVGLLGERYGWIPPADGYPAHVLEGQPWLEAHRGGKSVTELEILHGVLNDPKMAGRALFYFRSAEFAQRKGGDYVPASAEDARRQSELKERIRKSGFPVVEDYADPTALAERLEADLWTVLDETFPAAEVPDAVSREAMRHEAYAAPRRGLYLGGEAYLKALDEALASGQQWILIGGQSGGGKSALIANWTGALEKTHEDLVLHVHYLGATADASDPVSLVRRLVEAIRRVVGSEDEVPGDPEKLLEAVPLWLANASSWAGLKGKRFVIVIDALNGLTDRRDLRWFPSFLPERVQLVVSSLPGEVQDHLREKAEWTEVAVRPLDRGKAEELFVTYLRRFNKELPPDLVSRIMDHELVANPLFLRTLAEELRLFGVHERLGERLDHYLTSRTVDDLFERVLERVEEDNGADAVRKVMVGLWASRAGLTEEEIRAYANLKPAPWAYIRNALGNALLEGSGRIVFGHDYLRIAVSDRYLAGNNTLQNEGQSPEAIAQRQNSHAQLAHWFEDYAFLPEDAPGFRLSDARAAEEVPHQWREARNWGALKTSLTQRDMFEAMVSNRGNQELLSYWLDIEATTDLRIEREYETAWRNWAPEEAAEATGDIANTMQSLLRYSGRFKSDFVEVMARLALSTKTAVYGADNIGIAKDLNELAGLLLEKGDYSAAEPLFRRALVIAEADLGSQHHNVANCLNNLANLLQLRSDFTSAAVLYQRALKMLENYAHVKVRDVLHCINNLAVLRVREAKYAEAEPLYLRALAMSEEEYGPGDPLTASVLNNLGNLYLSKGEFHQAERVYTRALRMLISLLGPEHPDTAQTMLGLANFLSEIGDIESAEDLYLRSLAVLKRAYGEFHRDTAMCMNNLAVLLSDRGDIARAMALHEQVLGIRTKIFGERSPEVAMSLSNIGSLHKESGDLEVAEGFCRRSLDLVDSPLGPMHSDVASIISCLANVLYSKREFTEAEALFRKAVDIRENSIGPNYIGIADDISRIAQILCRSGHYAQAELLFRRAIEIQELTFGPDHIVTAGGIRNLAKYMIETRNGKAAEELCRRALNIRESVLGLENTETATSMDDLATALNLQKYYVDAEPIYAKALAIRKVVLGREHPDTAGSLINLAVLYANMGELSKAEKYCRESLEIRRIVLGSGDPATMNSVRFLTSLLEKCGRSADAESILSRGDFVSITAFAKAICCARSSDCISAFDFLAGVISAERYDLLWGKDIQNLVNADLREKIESAVRVRGLTEDMMKIPISKKLPLEKELRSIIGRNSKIGLKELIRDLGEHLFG